MKPGRPRPRLALVLGVVVLLAALGLSRLEVDNSPRAFMPAAGPLEQRVRAAFGPDEAVRIALLGEVGHSAAARGWLERVAAQVALTPGVAATLAPGQVEPAIARALGLETTGGSSALVLIETAEPAERRALMAGVRAAVAAAPAPHELAGFPLEPMVGGLPLLGEAFDEAAREVGERQLPVLVLLSLGALAWWLRPRRELLAPVLVVACVVGATLGLLGWLAVPIDLVLAVLPPLLYAISLATTLHLLLRWRERHEADPRTAVAATYRELGWVIGWSGVTTAIGFLSLASAPIAPVRHLGLSAAAGVAILTALAFYLVPTLLAASSARANRRLAHRRLECALQRLGRRAGGLATRRPWMVVMVAAGLALVAGAGIPRLGVESDATRYLSPDHPLRLTADRLEAAGMGLASLELILELPAADPLGRLPELAAFEAALRDSPLVLGVAGPGTAVGGLSTLPLPLLAARLAPFVAEEGRLVRVLVSVRRSGFEEVDALLAAARAVAAAELPGARLGFAGTYPRLLATQRSLLATLGWSLATTTLAIAILLLALLRDAAQALAALAPNLWPVVCLLGLMGWCGVPIDVASVMVAAVVVGLAVDDSLHLVGGLRRLEGELGRRGALVATLELATPAFVLTAVVLALGFGVCAFASFAPIRRFGLLAAGALALALVADLLILPALLTLAGRGRKPSADGERPADPP